MTKVLITQSKLDDLAETIGAKSGQNIPLTIDQMKNAIYNIKIPRGTKLINENGTYDVSEYAYADVAVSTDDGSGGGAVYQDQDGYLVLSDQGGGSSVTVEALNVTQNGTYTAPTGKAYSPVMVSVSGGGSTPTPTPTP